MPALLVAAVAAVQVLGLLGLGWARLSEGSNWQGAAQCVFYTMMLLVAATAAMIAGAGSALWPVCAVTVSVMVVGATISTGRELDATM